MRTGDVITRIGDREVETFRDIQTIIGQSAQQTMEVTYRRDGTSATTQLTPVLDVQTGAGRIGVYPWVDPVVASVTDGSSADLAGIRPGDRIREVGGTTTPHSLAVQQALQEAGASVRIRVERDGRMETLTAVPDTGESGRASLGLSWETMEVRSPRFGLVGGLVEGVRQAFETLALTVRGIGLLFSGVDLNQALMGPVRITYMVGEIATTSAEAGFGRALLSFFNFLSLISVTLFFMNLLPIPVLDGGQIVITVVEMLLRRPLHPRVVYHYQMIGNVIILGLMFFALFNDILFFARG